MDKETAVYQRYTKGAREFENALCCPTSYNPELLRVIPDEILQKDYGCGDPTLYVKEGETVLDLGSGGGKLCYIIAQVVGPSGKVIGVDMNDEMLSLARKYRKKIGDKLGYHNVEFKKAKIQNLRLNLENNEPLIPDNSIDVVVSNCVLNLVKPEDKRQLFDEIYRILKDGGRAVISDIVSDEDVPDYMQNDPELWSGCISGALKEDIFLKSFEDAGFHGIEMLKWNKEPWRRVDGIEFRSVTVAAYKGKIANKVLRITNTNIQSECCPSKKCSPFESFEQKLKKLNKVLQKDKITAIQVNVGNLCNQSCMHCHVEASPESTEVMSWETMKDIVEFLKTNHALNLDITGGAPELHPHIEEFISECSFHADSIYFRSNLTALFQKQELIKTLKNFKVELICSLPDISPEKTDYQRGKGVFEKSIRALRILNDAGYGYELPLNLVHNPIGFVLPELQEMIEERYKSYLKKEHGISFNRLFILNNMPIGRFRKTLERHGNYDTYMNTLRSSFNPLTLDGLMCKYILNIGWNGKLYDCDFNNALGLQVIPPNPPLAKGGWGNFKIEVLTGNEIIVGDYCYGCTAMKGSGCFGNVIK